MNESHILSSHLKNDLQCEQCEFIGKTKFSLARHIDAQHKDKVQTSRGESFENKIVLKVKKVGKTWQVPNMSNNVVQNAVIPKFTIKEARSKKSIVVSYTNIANNQWGNIGKNKRKRTNKLWNKEFQAWYKGAFRVYMETGVPISKMLEEERDLPQNQKNNWKKRLYKKQKEEEERVANDGTSMPNNEELNQSLIIFESFDTEEMPNGEELNQNCQSDDEPVLTICETEEITILNDEERNQDCKSDDEPSLTICESSVKRKRSLEPMTTSNDFNPQIVDVRSIESDAIVIPPKQNVEDALEDASKQTTNIGSKRSHDKENCAGCPRTSCIKNSTISIARNVLNLQISKSIPTFTEPKIQNSRELREMLFSSDSEED